MDNICKNCYFWKRNKENIFLGYTTSRYLLFGDCSSDKFVYIEDGNTPIDGFEYSDAEGYNASFKTGEQFGCIHFKEINNG
jgi:hypothetical protein